METQSENTEDYYREELHAIKEEIISLRNEFSHFTKGKPTAGSVAKNHDIEAKI